MACYGKQIEAPNRYKQFVDVHSLPSRLGHILPNFHRLSSCYFCLIQCKSFFNTTPFRFLTLYINLYFTSPSFIEVAQGKHPIKKHNERSWINWIFADAFPLKGVLENHTPTIGGQFNSSSSKPNPQASGRHQDFQLKGQAWGARATNGTLTI